MVALCALILLATVVAVGSFVNSVHFRNHVGLICTATSDSARELEQPLEILKERSTECNPRELNILATRLISRGSSVHHLRNCYDIYEYLSTVCKPDSRTQTALMSAYIRYLITIFRKDNILFNVNHLSYFTLRLTAIASSERRWCCSTRCASEVAQ